MTAPESRRSSCAPLVTVAAALAVCLVSATEASRAIPGSPAGLEAETRALVVERTSLATPASIAALVDIANTLRFNALVVDARSFGELHFNQGLEPRAAALAGQPPSFDPLAAILAAAHARGIRVHARVSVTAVASSADLPTARTHVVNAHPEWLMVPRPLARDLVLLDARSQLFLDRLLRWTRAQSPEGSILYSSPVSGEAADAVVALVADLAARYPVDGIHLDDVAFPTAEFDHSRAALEAFKADALSGLAEAQRRARELEVGADLTAWPDAMPDRWIAFRRDRLTALVARIRQAVRARRPATLVSAAVDPDSIAAGRQHLQDWRAWSDRQLVDVVCPVSRTFESSAFGAEMTDARAAAGDTPVWIAIGAAQLSVAETVDRIGAARKLGARGVVIGSYDSLMSQPDGLDYLTRVARAAFQP